MYPTLLELKKSQQLARQLPNIQSFELTSAFAKCRRDCRHEKPNHCVTLALFCWRDFLCHLKREVQNYQYKTGEKSLYPSKYMLTTYFKKFQRFKYISSILSLANCKQLRMCNCLYRWPLSAMFFLIDIRCNQFRVYLII